MSAALQLTVAWLQLFTRKAAQALFPNQRLQRWCFDVELLFLATRLRIPVAETAVTWTEIPGTLRRCLLVLTDAVSVLAAAAGAAAAAASAGAAAAGV